MMGKTLWGMCALQTIHHNSEYKQIMDFETIKPRGIRPLRRETLSRVLNMPVKRVHVHVSGRVQGVNYRRFTQQAARVLGITGWVRNLPDRRVEFVAEGDEEKLEELVRRCREGPTLAIVRDMEVRYEPPTGELDGFTIWR